MNNKKLLKIISRINIKTAEQIFWEKQIKIEERIENKFKKELISIFNKQRKYVLRRLSGKKSPKIVISKLLLNLKKERKEFGVVFSPILEDIIKDEGDLAYEQIGLDDEINMDDPNVSKFLKTTVIKFSDEVNKVTNRKIRREISDGLEKGEGIPKLSRRINRIFDGAEKTRSVVIARTESSRAMNFATVETYKQSGVVSGKKWLTAQDEKTCEFCSQMDGKIVDLEENFFEKGDSFRGIDGGVLKMDYGDVGYPPLHPRCRCSLTPILIED